MMQGRQQQQQQQQQQRRHKHAKAQGQGSGEAAAAAAVAWSEEAPACEGPREAPLAAEGSGEPPGATAANLQDGVLQKY
jgi:hypothetical protein